MALVVFLRGVNVGTAKRFSPAALAKELGARNVGAAGTFVVPGKAGAKAVQAAIAKALPFEADAIVVSDKDLLALVAAEPFARVPKDTKPFVTVLAAKPAKVPQLPLERPEGPGWQVRVTEVRGRFALSVRRNVQGRFYPNEVVEKGLGVRGTTRGWPTVLQVAKLLAE